MNVKHLLYTLSLGFFALTFAACSSGSAEQKQDAVPQAERIITIGGTITEISCALGVCDQIVATDKTSTYPENMQELPSVGYRNSIKAEGIIAQNPSLILAEKEYMNPDIYTQLESAGIPIHTFENKTTSASTAHLIQEIGKVLEKETEAQELQAQLEKELKATEDLLTQSTQKPKVLFVYARGHGTLSILGKNTFAETLIPLAGGTLAVPEIDGNKPLTTEALIKANPDYILFFNSGLASLGGVEGALEIQGVAQTAAGKNKNIIAMDGLLLSGFDSRLGKATYELAQLIHPELQTASL